MSIRLLFPCRIPATLSSLIPPATNPIIAVPFSDTIGALQIEPTILSYNSGYSEQVRDIVRVTWTKANVVKSSKKNTCSLVDAIISNSVLFAPATPTAMT